MEIKVGNKIPQDSRVYESKNQSANGIGPDKITERRPESEKNTNVFRGDLDRDKDLNNTLNESLEVADILAKAFNKAIKFQVHKDTKEVYVEIVDRDTGEVIKQLPPEEMIKLAASLEEFLGLIVDKKV